jgi:hypothetical protein
MTVVEDILSRVRITEVYQALTGAKPKHSGHGVYRGSAVWRVGDGYNVSIDDERSVWHDFVTDEGGGVLDLVVKVRGGSRQDALRWLAEFVGIEIEGRPLSQEDRQRWRKDSERIERYLPLALLWRRAAVMLTQETLDRLKGALFDSDLPWPEINEIYNIEQLLKRLVKSDGIELIEEFEWWKDKYPGITEALVKQAQKRERIEVLALQQFIREMGPADVCQPGY